jgi:catechol 2,3-dioxygenase-like lactoylglutathione lyase family enzyme
MMDVMTDAAGPPPRLGYVVRFVAALEPAVAFYRDVLGQALSKRTEHWAQFDCGSLRFGLYDLSTMAAQLGVDPEQLGVPPGALELAFEVADCDAAYDAAVGAGATGFSPPQDRPWGERTGYLLDPDGALVELFTRMEPSR